MDYRELGQTGITVSRIALGCGNFGGIGSAPAFFGQGESREQAFALMDAARALGITTVDTADAYGGGRSERWIGEWLRERGADGVVARPRSSIRSRAIRLTVAWLPSGSGGSSQAA